MQASHPRTRISRPLKQTFHFSNRLTNKNTLPPNGHRVSLKDFDKMPKKKHNSPLKSFTIFSLIHILAALKPALSPDQDPKGILTIETMECQTKMKIFFINQ